MTLAKELAEKSVEAAITAIEVYNKPNFYYREGAFAILMANAWELLLKAKWLLDHNDAIESLYATDRFGAVKKGRSGNSITHGVVYLAAKLLEDQNCELERGCYDNILGLVEIRDNAVHFLNKDIYIGRRVLEIGTASLRNYLILAQYWFHLDLSKYNFFLMPISFYHGFESAEPVSRACYPEQIQKLLQYLDTLEATDDKQEGTQHVALHLETKLVRSRDATSIPFRLTDDPTAPQIAIREEDFRKEFPWSYRDLRKELKKRYNNFKENDKFHKIRKALERENKFTRLRVLDLSNPKSSRMRIYNPNILMEFDKHYDRRNKN